MGKYGKTDVFPGGYDLIGEILHGQQLAELGSKGLKHGNGGLNILYCLAEDEFQSRLLKFKAAGGIQYHRFL